MKSDITNANKKEILMESRIQKTIELHDKGYNCAQAVACAYCDLVDVDEKTALRATEAFGAGMGGRETTCGAISGAVFLAGMKNADGIVGAPKSKANTENDVNNRRNVKKIRFILSLLLFHQSQR